MAVTEGAKETIIRGTSVIGVFTREEMGTKNKGTTRDKISITEGGMKSVNHYNSSGYTCKRYI